MLGHRRWWLAHTFRQIVDAEFTVDQRPEQLHPGGVGQHPEDLHDQMSVVVSQLLTCIHTQIIVQGGGADYLDYGATKLNAQPRKTLSGRTPAEALAV
ncbi:hypothetical protein MHEL_49190 [Mycolicibacterium helvum]|uniref:Uncharacterized protein n=1 Tax=Mycolicibacterium helvum TaxID=1534349 RepID=A0A7I7TEU0_9MYCO|nr:hypothetical protein MHEL_49190 [Mycolicibacterium helvum]